MHYLAEYGIFLAKIITIILGILILLIGIIAISMRGKSRAKDRLEVKKINDKYKSMKQTIDAAILSKAELKKAHKEDKHKEKDSTKQIRKKIFLLNFHGDIRASAVKQLSKEVTAILLTATPKDEVVLKLESHGGMVHGYGLAASQLARFRMRQIPLTVIVDKIAASGGYLMASVANQIIAAPFAIVGSIGVLAQLPNFHRLLQKNDIDYIQMTAGEYKRTLTLFGKITEKGREKFQEEIEHVHDLFKQFILEFRPKIDINKVATGEHWYGSYAIELNLVDRIQTSDDYLLQASETADIYKVCFIAKKHLSDKISLVGQAFIDKIIYSWRQQDEQSRYI